MRLSVQKLLNLNVLWFCVNAQYAALIPVVIPTQILLFVNAGSVGSAEQAAFLSWLTAGASLISLFMPPLVGHVSDRTPGRFGRRRPYVLFGGLLQVLSVIFLATANNTVSFLLGLSLLHVGNNILTPAYQGLIPDQVPQEQRGAASGYVGAMTILGNVVGLVLAALLLGSVTQKSYNAVMIRSGARTFYVITSVLMLLGLVITLLGVREEARPANLDRKRIARLSFSQRLVQNWLRPWHNYNFTLVFGTRFSIMLGLAMFMTFIEYYFARVERIPNFVEFTAGVAVLALGGGVVSGIISGLFSDRLKRRAPLVTVAAICMSLASFAFVVIPHTEVDWLWPLGVLFGLGYGTYMSVDWALSIDVLPSLDDAGKDLGLWSASTTVPAVIAPLLGNLLISLAANSGKIEAGYRLVFIAATCCLVIAAICILFVREQKSARKTQRCKQLNGRVQGRK